MSPRSKHTSPIVKQGLFDEMEVAPPVKPAKRETGEFSSAKDLLSKYQVAPLNKHISHEFQSFGCHLAESLADKRHTPLYIKLAKQLPRAMLEQALRFVIDSTADNKAKLFMWKLQQLKQQAKEQAASEQV